MYAQIPNLKQVYFAGGEPLMIREHKWFLEEIIRQGYADKILIRYNTNGLLVDDEIIELWKKFKKVKVGFSIDAVGDRNYYIRYPSDWVTIERNLHKLDNTPDNIQVSIATAIQILNVKHLADFAKWKITQNFKKVNLENTVGGIQAGAVLLICTCYIFLHSLVLDCCHNQIKQKCVEALENLLIGYMTIIDKMKTSGNSILMAGNVGKLY
jgi:sulfatase maturation enzyme AslB (radical SAM superfamily)